jgi:hypothetical protein
MSVDIRRFLTATGWSAACALVVLAAPATALAEPAPPPPPAPGPLMLQQPPAPVVPAPPAPAPVINAAAPIVPAPAPLAPAPLDPAPVDPAAPPVDPAAPPAPAPGPVQHLASPDSLPAGTTMDPVTGGADSPNTSYLKDLWHAVQNQEISGKEALILGLSQRGMNTPIPQQAPGPNVPTQFPRDAAPVDPALAPPPPPPGGPLVMPADPAPLPPN